MLRFKADFRFAAASLALAVIVLSQHDRLDTSGLWGGQLDSSKVVLGRDSQSKQTAHSSTEKTTFGGRSELEDENSYWPELIVDTALGATDGHALDSKFRSIHTPDFDADALESGQSSVLLPSERQETSIVSSDPDARSPDIKSEALKPGQSRVSVISSERFEDNSDAEVSDGKLPAGADPYYLEPGQSRVIIGYDIEEDLVIGASIVD